MKQFLIFLQDKIRSLNIGSRLKSFFAFLQDKFRNLNLKTPPKGALLVGIIALALIVVTGVVRTAVKSSKAHPVASERKIKKAESKKIQGKESIVEYKPFDFSKSIIRSLHFAKEAEDKLKSIYTLQEQPNAGVKATADIKGVMDSLKAAEYEMKPYLLSGNENMKRSAQQFQASYILLMQGIQRDSSNPQQVAAVPPAQKPIPATNQTDLIGASVPTPARAPSIANQPWKLLAYATLTATYALVDQKREDNGRRIYLTITSFERAQLLNELRTSFGENIQQGVKVGQSGAEAAPALFWAFLVQPLKKTADAK